MDTPPEPAFDIGQHSLKARDLIRISSRNFRVNPGRTLLTVLGTSVGISTVVILVSLGYGLQGILLGKLITTPESLLTVSASYPSGSTLEIDQSTIASITAMANVKEVSPLAEFPGSVQVGSISGLALIDVVDSNYSTLSGDLSDIGTSIGKTPGVVMSSEALRLLNIPADTSAIGKKVSVTIFYSPANGGATDNVSSQGEIPIIGIDNSATEPVVIVSNTIFSTPPPYYKELYIEADSDTVFAALRSTITQQGFIISAHIDLVRQAQQVTNIITLILAVFGVAALLVSAIGMFNTMIVGFLERTYEVGVMKALGATDGDIEKLFLMESLIMGVAGGVVGISLGLIMGFIFNFIISIVSAHFGGSSFALFVAPIWFLALVIGFAAVIGLAAGFVPARRASKLSPKEAFLRK